MAATIVTHMMISLNSHVGRAPNRNANFRKVSTIQQFENVTEVKYRSVIEQEQEPEGGAQFYQFNLNESATTISEISLAEVKKAVRTISESATTIAETSLVHKGTHTITESNTAITEGLTKQRTARRTLSETGTSIGESIQKSVNRPKTITEPGTAITEDLQAHKRTFKTLTPESTTISETSLDKIAKKVRQLIETPTDIDESLTRLRSVTFTEAPTLITEELITSRLFSFTLTPEHVPVKGSSGHTYSFNHESFTTLSYASSPELIKKVIHQFTEVTTITDNLLGLKRLVRSLSDSVPLGEQIISRLVHHILTENVSVTESLSRIRRPSKLLTEDPIDITESLATTRFYYRSINPDSFTPESFTTGAFESFKILNEDAVEITEELEAFVLPSWQKVLTEDPVVITESLTAVRTFVRTINESPIIIGESLTATVPPLPVPTGGGGGANRRRIRRARYNAFLKTLQLQPIKTPEPEPEHEPLIFEVELTESPIPITESLTALKIVKEKILISVAAATPPPQIIEKTVYVDRIREKEKEKIVEVQPPPIIRAQDVIVSKPKPIQVEQEILVSTQAYSDKIKNKAASAKLEVLQRLAMLSELEELI